MPLSPKRANSKRFARQTGLSFFIKIKKLNGKAITRRSSKKSIISHFLSANSQKYAWIYIKVTYKPGISNDGKYKPDQKHELKKAWKCFTEESFIKEVIRDY